MTEKKEIGKKVIIEKKDGGTKEVETYKGGRDYSERKPEPTQSTGPRNIDQREKEK